MMKPFLLIVCLLLLAGCFSCASKAVESLEPKQAPPMVTVGNELAARGRLDAIAKAEAMYQIQSGGDYGTLDQLIAKGYTNDPTAGQLSNYRFEVQVQPGGFSATAVPVKYGISGIRSFYIDQSNAMRSADKAGAKATASDPEQ